MKRIMLFALCLCMMQSVVIGQGKNPGNETFNIKSPRKVALIVQNHAAPGSRIPMMALTDALTARLAGCGFMVINPYNAFGLNQNRSVVGEKTPEVSAMGLGKKLGAEGVITASVTEFLDITSGTPVKFHQYSIRLAFNLADTWSGAVVCGDTIRVKGPKYTNNQVAQNRSAYLGELLHDAAEKCADRLKKKAEETNWTPTPPKPAPPRPLPLPAGPLTLSDMESSIQKLIEKMRLNSTFRTNYDKAQSAIGRLPLAIVAGIVDKTNGKAPGGGVSDLLAAGSQTARMTLVKSGLFEAKDDTLVTTITDRIIKSGNSPLEDGELMSALKQHGSPDFFVVGDMMFFPEGTLYKYRLRLALHDLHTGKIVFEDTFMITKRKDNK